MLEEFHPNMLNVAGKENNSADALSRLGMADNLDDEVEWEILLPLLTYQDKVRERLQLLFALAAEKELEPAIKFPLASYLVRYYYQHPGPFCMVC